MNTSEEIIAIVKKIMDEKHISLSELARRTGYAKSSISYYLNGVRDFPVNNTDLFANALGVTSNDLLGLKTPSMISDNERGRLIPINSNTVSIPVLGSIACGEPILAEENISEYREVFADTLPSGECFFLKAKGDSMEPKIPNGSYVLIRKQPDVESGEIAAVIVNGDNEATLKKVRKLGNSVLLEAINEAYEPYLISEEHHARIIGKAMKVEFDL